MKELLWGIKMIQIDNREDAKVFEGFDASQMAYSKEHILVGDIIIKDLSICVEHK